MLDGRGAAGHSRKLGASGTSTAYGRSTARSTTSSERAFAQVSTTVGYASFVILSPRFRHHTRPTSRSQAAKRLQSGTALASQDKLIKSYSERCDVMKRLGTWPS